MVEALFERFDVYGQWFFLSVVYRYELLCLPLVGCLLLLWKRNRWWTPLKGILLFLTLIYLLLFRMHWYSWFAWPFMIAVLGFDWSREHWYRVTGLHLQRFWDIGLQVIRSLQDLVREPRRLRVWVANLVREPKWFVWVAAVIVGVPGVIYFLSIPSDLLFILVIIACAAGLLAWVLTVSAIDERLFRGYLARDPRMRGYLNWVRWLRADRAHAAKALLADKGISPDQHHVQKLE